MRWTPLILGMVLSAVGWVLLALSVLALLVGCTTAPARYEAYHVAGSAFSVVTRDGRALPVGSYLVRLEEAPGSATVILRDGTVAPARLVSVPGKSGQARFTVAPSANGVLVVAQQ